ncbi:MAG: hypothetical protein MHM6MM_001718 [Cercozoa sp. M6MM]
MRVGDVLAVFGDSMFSEQAFHDRWFAKDKFTNAAAVVSMGAALPFIATIWSCCIPPHPNEIEDRDRLSAERSTRGDSTTDNETQQSGVRILWTACKQTYRDAKQLPAVWWTLLAYFTALDFVNGTTGYRMKEILVDQFEFSVEKFPIAVYSSAFKYVGVLAVFCGRAVDRLGHRRTTLIVLPFVFAAVNVALMVTATVLDYKVRSFSLGISISVASAALLIGIPLNATILSLREHESKEAEAQFLWYGRETFNIGLCALALLFAVIVAVGFRGTFGDGNFLDQEEAGGEIESDNSFALNAKRMSIAERDIDSLSDCAMSRITATRVCAASSLSAAT